MSVSRSLPTQRVDPPGQTRPSQARAAAVYDFDVVADLPPASEPDAPATGPEPAKHP